MEDEEITKMSEQEVADYRKELGLSFIFFSLMKYIERIKTNCKNNDYSQLIQSIL